MAITRLRVSGAESNPVAPTISGPGSEWDFIVSELLGSSPTVDTAHARSGDYCWGGFFNSGWFVPATRQLRVSQHRWPTTYGVTNSLAEFLDAGDNVLVAVQRLIYTGLIQLVVGGVVVATGTHPIITGAYTHIGIDLKIDSVNGWVNVYVGGVADITYAGDTGNADVVKFIQRRLDTGVNYSDDWYMDDTTGEAGPDVVPDKAFVYRVPSSNGTYSDCTGQDGDSVNNYQNVDDRPHDSDTTYNEATALDQRDSFPLPAYTAPAGWVVDAVLPVVHVRKTDGAVDTQVALIVLVNGTQWQGNDQAVDETYTLRLDRCDTPPGGGSWGTGWVPPNVIEVGYRGRGDF